MALRCDGRKKRFLGGFCFCVVFAYVGVPSSAPIVRWMSSWSWLQTDGATRVCMGRQTIELLSACDWCLISAWCLRILVYACVCFPRSVRVVFLLPRDMHMTYWDASCRRRISYISLEVRLSRVEASLYLSEMRISESASNCGFP